MHNINYIIMAFSMSFWFVLEKVCVFFSFFSFVALGDGLVVVSFI